MRNLIIQASEILEDKFKIKPEKTKLYIHEDIHKLLNQTRNPQAQSIFFPRDLSAHVLIGRLDFILHEYHGHGLYCEQSLYGKKMVENENRFNNMPQEEIQKVLLLHEYQKPNFEGHALWTEDFLLTKLNKFEILENRLKELKTLVFESQFHPDLKTQKDVYNRIKQFELENGVFELWYSLGFPRQFDRNTLIDIAKEKLNSRYDNLIFLINFGSKNPRGDIDICAVLKDNTILDEYKDSRTVDMPQYIYSDFLRRMRLFDIVITQPLLTGKLIYGDKNEFEILIKKLRKQKPTQKSVRYLQEKSRWCFNCAVECFNQDEIHLDDLELTLNNLSYALSYNKFANRYKLGASVLTLDQIENNLLNKIRECMKLIESKKEKINKTKEFIKIVEKEIF